MRPKKHALRIIISAARSGSGEAWARIGIETVKAVSRRRKWKFIAGCPHLPVGTFFRTREKGTEWSSMPADG